MTHINNSKAIITLMILLMLYLQFISLPVEVLAVEESNEDGGANPSSNLIEPQIDKSVFKSGDGLMIDTFPDTSFFLNKTFSIDDKGYAEFPLIGKVKVITMSIEQLQNYLKNEYKAYLRSPNLYVKPLIRVSVLGGVRTPGLFYVDASSSLWDVVKLAGGTTLESGLRNMCWERSGYEVNDNLIPILQKGTSLASIGFRSGDQLWTPSASSDFWMFLNNILPVLTFTTTLIFFYYSYQQNMILIQTTGR